MDDGGADDETRAAPRHGIQSVELAMQVIEALEAGRAPMTLGQIAAESGMSASKAHRYLVSLGRIGMVVQSQRNGLYDFGPALRRLGTEALRRMDEVGTTAEFLPALRDRTTHSVNTAVWGDGGPVVVHWEYGAHTLPINVRVGATLPLLGSSVGRVFLAVLPEAMTRPILEAEGSGASREQRAQVESIRAQVLERGVARTAGGVIPGLVSVAAPVFPAHELPLAVSVAVPARAADDATLDAIERDLLATTSAITRQLGGEPR